MLRALSRSLSPAPRPTTLAAESAYHYVVLTFTNAQITGKAVRQDGTVIETFTLPHAP